VLVPAAWLAASANATGKHMIHYQNEDDTTATTPLVVKYPPCNLQGLEPDWIDYHATTPVTLTGSYFAPGCSVTFTPEGGGNAVSVTPDGAQITSTEITMSVPGSLSWGHSYAVAVSNPQPGGGSAAGTPLLVLTLAGPQSSSSAISRSSIPVNSPDTTVTVMAPTPDVEFEDGSVAMVQTGSGTFPAGVDLGGQAEAQTAKVMIPAAALTQVGAGTLTIKNPSPGGGSSSGIGFTVAAPNLKSAALQERSFGDYTLQVSADELVPGSSTVTLTVGVGNTKREPAYTYLVADGRAAIAPDEVDRVRAAAEMIRRSEGVDAQMVAYVTNPPILGTTGQAVESQLATVGLAGGDDKALHDLRVSFDILIQDADLQAKPMRDLRAAMHALTRQYSASIEQQMPHHKARLERLIREINDVDSLRADPRAYEHRVHESFRALDHLTRKS
jgi:hypothetical protein